MADVTKNCRRRVGEADGHPNISVTPDLIRGPANNGCESGMPALGRDDGA